MPRACRTSISSSAPGSSGASVTSPHRARREQAVEQREVRVTAASGRMRAEPRRGDERALRGVRRECAGHAPALAGTARSAATRSSSLGRDERRQIGRDAGLEQRVACLAIAVARRRRGSRCRRTRSPGGRRSPARRCPGRRPRPDLHTSPSSTPTSPGTSRPSTSAASTPSLIARAPSGRRRSTPRAARRASSASTPASNETIATFASPSAASSAASTSARGSAPLACATIRAHARAACIRRDDVDHEVPEGLPSRTIAIVEIMLSTSFCAVPALSRVEPAITSGPTTTAIS